MMKLILQIFICDNTFMIHQVLEFLLEEGEGKLIRELPNLKLLSRDINNAINGSKELWNWLLFVIFPCRICSKESKLWIKSQESLRANLLIANNDGNITDCKIDDDANNDKNINELYSLKLIKREFHIRGQHFRVRLYTIIIFLIVCNYYINV